MEGLNYKSAIKDWSESARFSVQKRGIFCKDKTSGNPRRRRGTERSKASAKRSRTSAELYITRYVAQGSPKIATVIAEKDRV
jgi:ABC-type sulfate transport system substrate-binding protein